MWWFLLLGFLAGVLALLLPLRRAQRELDEAEVNRQKLAHDRQRLVDFMHHMTEALGEGLSRQDLHQRIVHAAILCSGALSACIFERTRHHTMRSVAVEGLFPPHRPLSDEKKRLLGTRARFIEEVLQSEEFPVGEGVVGRVAATGRGELLVDAAADPRMVKHEDPALAVRSVIAVPLRFRDRFFGVLAATNPAGDASFNEDDFGLIQSLAEQAALALHNADLLQLQMEKKQLDLDLAIASGIQQMLLPQGTPNLPGLELDARYAAAQRVGGDLYDFFPLAEGRLGLAVADVSGKGIAASLLMAISRTNLRQIAPRHATPAAALRELNRVLAGEIHPGFYVTLLYAIIDLAAGEVRLARAGHELPLFVRADPADGLVQAEFVESEGMALGLVDEETFGASLEERTETFRPGDTLVLYTDGVTEIANHEGKEFSGARLADCVRALHGRPPREINDGILTATRRFAGEGRPQDDLTLFTLVRTATPPGTKTV